MNVDFRKLRYFVAVYEERSFSKAADREHVAQPALSVQVRALEDEFNVRLFERTPQGIIPTAAGHRLHKLSSDLLAGLRNAHQEMKTLNGALSGLIRIGVMPSICWGALASILTRFAARHPQVDVRIVEAFSGTLADKLTAGDIDVAICNRPMSSTQLAQRLLLRDRMLLVSGRARGLEPWRAYRASELHEFNLILPSPTNSVRRHLEAQIRSGALQPTRTIEIDGLSATFRLVEAGEWSTILPSCALVNDIESTKITINPIIDIELFSEIFELTRLGDQPPIASQFFVQMIHDEILRTPQFIVAPQGV